MKTRFLLTLIYLALCLAASGVVFGVVRDRQTATRGVVLNEHSDLFTVFGVNVALEQYADAELDRALDLIRRGGFTFVRQHFSWNELEPRPNEPAWEKADRLIARASARGLQIVAVIDTTPAWARDPGEADLVHASPANPADYARFVAKFVQRYGDRVRHIQVWDNPNVHPFWGRRNAEPIEYTALLRASALAIRAVNPNVKILAAGLAPSGELIRGHPDYSDALFLRGMYQAGAREHFDILGVKPYGMWSGPEDRRVALDVMNFSRAILLREEMLAYGDVGKPVWAVEFGWNALPSDWRGAPSPWGTDTEATQSARLANAVARAQSEWAWMPVLIAQTFQPNAPSDDPVWGFALVTPNGEPRALYAALTRAVSAPPPRVTFDSTRFYVALIGLGLVALVAAWRGGVAAWQLPWEHAWRKIELRFGVLPEIAQFAALALAVLAFYYSRNAALNFGLLALVVGLFALRLDLALAITVFTVPFYLFPKNLVGGAQFSLVELLTLSAVAAWMLRAIVRRKLARAEWRGAPLRLTTLDWAVIAFGALGLIAVAFAANFGVAMREWRVMVIEPALFYALVRVAAVTRRDLGRLVAAFLLSAVAVALIGLYQFAFTNWVIIGEGVRRVLAVYGSPNNLALYLDRALPLLIALALFDANRRRRIVSALSALIVAGCLYLTYSRGAWVLALPAGLAFIGWASGKRARLVVLALIGVAAIALVPFLQTERAQSLFQAGTGTGFFRTSVWLSALAMIRDHPILGVGLDNFLYAYPNYIHPDAWREPNLSHPHNIVLDFWVRLGIAGVGVLAWMLGEFYRRGGKCVGASETRALGIGLLAAMTAGLAHGLIDAAYFYVDLAFVWMLLLSVVAQGANVKSATSD